MKNLMVMLTFLFIWSAQSQILNKEIKDKLDSQIEEYVESNSPGLAVGIVQNNVIFYEKYIGLANLENNTAVNKNTRFNIASNAKQFTALCILKLNDEGRIKLGDDIRQYLPDLFKEIKDPITISNLLTHSSGIRDIYDLWALKGQTWWQLFIDNGDAMDLIKGQKELNFNPGERYMYSNSNYIILTEIVKAISGQSFNEYALEMFKALGMDQTAFLTNYMAVIPDKARPYGNWNGWKEYPVITETHGDGALFTSLQDQLKWEIIIQDRSGAALSSDILNRSQLPIPDSNISDYGYGLMFGEYNGMKYNYHDGNTGAYNATFLRFPEKNTSVVVMSNNGNVPSNYLAKQLADICFPIESDKAVKFPSGPEAIEELNTISAVIGDYKTNDGTIIKIVEKDGYLYREIYRRDPVRLIRESGNLFYYETNEDLKITFTRNEKGQRQFTIYLSSQEPNTGTVLPSFNADQEYYASLNGTYFNTETDTSIEIRHLEENKYTIIKNGRARDGELLTEDYLRMNSYQIGIDRDAEKNIKGLMVKNGRIDRVRFVKN
ncbi:MAG: beta-lactamase family protein [Flavobacteriaceae bacterium]|nr:beta-lactamase family protein [Flavobacteriaceae bacterium]